MDLSSVQQSTASGPTRFAMHATEGYGKSSLAAHFPRPLFIGAERGIPRDLGFAVDVITPKTWIDIFNVVGSLIKDKHDFSTVVFDTVDWIEPMIHRFVLDRDSERQTEMNAKGRKLLSIEDYGYGKGYLVAEEEFRKLIGVLDELQSKRDMHIVMLMHTHVKTFKNPAGPDYDRFEPKCQQRIARVVVEWAENVLFGYFQVLSSKEPDDVARNEKTARAKGIGAGVRMIGTQNTAMYDAKNRVGLPPELELPQTYDDLLSILLGENVPVNARRAQLRDGVKREEGWADRDRRVGGERTRADIDASRSAERDPTDTGRMHSSAQLAQQQKEQRERDESHARDAAPRTAATEKHDARNWTPPKDDAKTIAPPAKTNGVNGARVDTDALRRMTTAISESGRIKGDAYRKQIEGWVAKAGGDPNKLNSIIKRVETDLAITIS